MDFNEFAETIKAKHPQYKDKDNLELAKAVVAKYPQYEGKVSFEAPATEAPQEPNVMGQVAKEALGMALPSPDRFNTPIAPTSSNPALAGLQAAGQTLQDPSRLSPTMSQPGKFIGETVEAVAEAQGVPSPLAKALGVTQGIKADPQNYMVGIGGAAEKAGAATASGFKGIKNFVKNLFTKPSTDEELNVMSKELGDTITKARQKVGAKIGELKGTNEDALDRLGRIADKGIEAEMSPQEVAKMHKEYFSSRAPLMEEAGMKAPKGVKPPDIEVYVKGTMGGGKNPNTGQPLQKINIYGVRGKPELLKAEFGDAAPASVPESVLKQKGLLPEHTVSGPQFKTPQEEVKYLVKMKEAMKDQISKRTMDSSGNLVKSVSSNDERAFTAGIRKIEERLSQLPGGKELMAENKKFSELADIYDDLATKMKNPNEAREFLRTLFINPKGKKLDLLNKLEKLEKEIGTSIVVELRKAFESTKGLTYEQLKHPVAGVLKATLPNVGPAIRESASIISSPIAAGVKGLQTPFNTPDMQSLKYRLRNAK